MSERLGWSHAVALAIGAAACASVMLVGSPKVVDYSPAVRELSARNGRLTRALVASDSATIAYRRRVVVRDSAIAVMRQRERDALNTSQRLAGDNRRLVDSLARARPDLAVPLTILGLGIASQDSACSVAAHTCAARADSIQTQKKERDSIVGEVTALRNDYATLSRDAIRADSLAEAAVARTRRTLLLTRIGAGILVVLALLK